MPAPDEIKEETPAMKKDIPVTDDPAYVEWSDAAKLQFFHSLNLRDGDHITAPGLAVSHGIPLRRAREVLHHALGCKLLQRTGPDRFVRWSEPDETWCNPEPKKKNQLKGKEYTRTCRACGKYFTALLMMGGHKRQTCSRECANEMMRRSTRAFRERQQKAALAAKKGKWWTA